MSVNTKAPRVPRMKLLAEEQPVGEGKRFGQHARPDEIRGLILGRMTVVYIMASLRSLAHLAVFRRERASISRIGVFVLAFTMISLGWYLPSCHAGESSLLEQAKRRFSRTFTDCETELLTNAPEGENSSCAATGMQTEIAEDDETTRMQSDIDATLLDWICTDPEASKLVSRRGIQLSASRVRGKLDLSYAKVTFPLTLQSTLFEDSIIIDHATLASLDLDGSQMRGMSAKEAHLMGDLDLSKVHSMGAFDADRIVVAGDIKLSDGFSSIGEIQMRGAKVDGDFVGDSGIFIGLDNGPVVIFDTDLIVGSAQVFIADLADPTHAVALDMSGSTIQRYVQFRDGAFFRGDIILDNDQVKRDVEVVNAKCSDRSAVRARQARIEGGLFWQKLDPNCAAVVELDVKNASVGPIYDDQQSWPQVGNLLLDGFSYARFAEGPKSAERREDWLRLQPDPNNSDFPSQPYDQLFNVLRKNGDECGAKHVEIALEDARRQQQDQGLFARCWDFVFWLTIDYGYEPKWAFGWAIFLVAFGSLLCFLGKQTIVPNNAAANRFNPLIYSLEKFLPLVDLGQSKNWTPDASSLSGRGLRAYLWLHVLLGWFFTSMIIAAVTGLVKK